MSVHPEVELACDGAGGPYDCETPSIYARTGTRARQEAREGGWLVSQPGGKDYCPRHRAASARHLPSGGSDA